MLFEIVPDRFIEVDEIYEVNIVKDPRTNNYQLQIYSVNAKIVVIDSDGYSDKERNSMIRIIEHINEIKNAV